MLDEEYQTHLQHCFLLLHADCWRRADSAARPPPGPAPIMRRRLLPPPPGRLTAGNAPPFVVELASLLRSGFSANHHWEQDLRDVIDEEE